MYIKIFICFGILLIGIGARYGLSRSYTEPAYIRHRVKRKFIGYTSVGIITLIVCFIFHFLLK